MKNRTPSTSWTKDGILMLKQDGVTAPSVLHPSTKVLSAYGLAQRTAILEGLPKPGYQNQSIYVGYPVDNSNMSHWWEVEEGAVLPEAVPEATPSVDQGAPSVDQGVDQGAPSVDQGVDQGAPSVDQGVDQDESPEERAVRLRRERQRAYKARKKQEKK